MTCTNTEAKAALRALFLGELDAPGHARLRKHAGTCAECGEAYERLSRVESALEKRVLPKEREALLEAQLLARVSASAPERRFFWSGWKVLLPVAAVAAVAMLVVLPRVRETGEDEWQARSGSKEGAFGVRAFCVSPERGVQGEAKPGEALVCSEGSAVQFSYTAPQAVRLSVTAKAPSGEVLQFFPRDGEAAPVAPGVDVPLEYSTPVQGGWLSAPLEVHARFLGEQGQLLGETRVTLTPAK